MVHYSIKIQIFLLHLENNLKKNRRDHQSQSQSEGGFLVDVKSNIIYK